MLNSFGILSSGCCGGIFYFIAEESVSPSTLNIKSTFKYYTVALKASCYLDCFSQKNDDERPN